MWIGMVDDNMGVVFILSILLSTNAFTKVHANSTSGEGEKDIDYFFDYRLLLFPAIPIVLLACLICCCRNKRREGYSSFNNDNEGNPPWDRRQPTHVIIQPIVTVRVPTENSNFGVPDGPYGALPSMPAAPPGYNESMKNTQMSCQFVNPPMPNQFMNPPMQNNFNNSPMPGNCNNLPPTAGNFNNPPMPSDFNNPPPNNPNTSTYYTKY